MAFLLGVWCLEFTMRMSGQPLVNLSDMTSNFFKDSVGCVESCVKGGKKGSRRKQLGNYYNSPN